jgi:hypothetical protein
LREALAAAAPGLAPAGMLEPMMFELLPVSWALACREAGGRLIATPDLLALTTLPSSLSRAGLAPLGALFPALAAAGDPFYRPYFDAAGRFALGPAPVLCRNPRPLPLSPHPAPPTAEGGGRRARALALRAPRRGC